MERFHVTGNGRQRLNDLKLHYMRKCLVKNNVLVTGECKNVN